MSNNNELIQAIQELRQEINALENSDSSTRENLMQLTNMMQDQLDGNVSTVNLEPTVNIPDLITEYEVKYPKVTAMVNDLMTRLAAMGI